MKILHLIHHSFPHLTGYSVRTNSIIHHQREHGCQIMAFTFPMHDFVYSRDKEKEDRYIHIAPLKSCYHRIPFLGLWLSLTYFVKTLSYFFHRQQRCQVIHAHSPWYVGLAALKLGKLWQIPVIYEVRGFWEQTSLALSKKQGWLSYCCSKFYGYLTQAMENRVLVRADAIAAISGNIKTEILARKLQIDPAKIFIVPNSVDLSTFFPCPKDRKLLDRLEIKNQIIIGYISSLRSIEGLEYLLNSVKLLRNQCIKVIIVGEGSDRPKLQALTKALAIEDKVIFTGKIPHQEIRNYYALIDIFVVPRTKDRVCQIVTPLKPLEAMAMGKCVLVSNVSGLLELIDEKQTGYSFEAENSNDLAEKIDYLIVNKTVRERTGINARQWVSENRNWKIVVKKYFDIIEFVHAKNIKKLTDRD